MRKQWKRCLPLAILLLLATLAAALHAKQTPQTPCRPNPEICQPKQETPPCQYICPDADTR